MRPMGIRRLAACGARAMTPEQDQQNDNGTRTYFTNMASALGGEAQSLGVLEGWKAPVAIFDALNGFGEECWVDSSPVTVIASRLRGSQVTWLCGKATGRTSSTHNVALQPKGGPNHARAKDAIRFAQTYLSDDLIDRVADSIKPGGRASSSIRDDLIFHPDRDLEVMANRHVKTAMSGGSALELEGSAILMVSHLLRRYHGFSSANPDRGGLAPWQLKRACELMEARLDEDLGLDDLAGAVGCSPTHFSRAFKQSTGKAPFQWLLELRIDVARQMLTNPELSIVQVALSVGFSAQPQFTTAFRRVTGATPGAWRRSQL